jgi:peptide deformylase
MVKEIIQYPTTPSLEYGANVRFFNNELFEVLQDLKDTIDANSLEALAAYQIGSPLQVIVVKNSDGSFTEIINPRIIKREGSFNPIETTAYFPGLSATTTRYEKIKIMFDDRAESQQFLEAQGDLAATLQRKIDYLFGANFRMRLDKAEQVVFDAKLEHGTDAIFKNDCPTTFKRDRLLVIFKTFFALGLIALGTKFFISEANILLLKNVETIILAAMGTTLIGYFFYAQYEGKQYKQCTSCQIGNIIGSTAIASIRLIILALATYFLLY